MSTPALLDANIAFWTALDRRLDPASAKPIVVALSGGGDSLALLHLARDWAHTRERRVLALTVDHRLHPESARWTEEAGDKAHALGVDWRAIAWEGEKPATGLPAAARRARHALLAEVAREVGAVVILMGHTANDIAEGEIMRALDAPGIGRLREWSPSPVWPEGRGIFLLRPMLGATRERLRSLLVDRGATWLDDPANNDSRHPRIRARKALARGGVAEASDLDLDAAIPGLARKAAILGDDALALPCRALVEAEPAVARRVLGAALLSVSGRETPPRRAHLDHLLDRARRGETRAATLAGAKALLSADELYLAPEPGRRGVAQPWRDPRWLMPRFMAACGLIATEGEARAASPFASGMG